MSPLIWKIVFLLSIQHSLCAFDPTIIQGTRQSGSSLSDNVQRKHDSDHVIFDNEKRTKEGSSAYNRDENGFNGGKLESKNYNDRDSARKEYDNGRQSLGESEVLDQGKNSFAHHGNGYYKKGHHKTGFSNNYHKDESGNNSSFYEDSDNETGHRSFENNGGYYGGKSKNSFRDGIRDASYTGRDRAQQGMRDNRENFNNYRGYYGDRNDNRYNDDRRNYLQDEAGHYFDQNGKEIYYSRERHNPITHKDYMPSFGYPRHYLDSLPKGHYKEGSYGDPYSRNNRYFPSHDDYYGRETYYPRPEYNNRNFRNDFYNDEYVNKYGRDFDQRGRYRKY